MMEWLTETMVAVTLLMLAVLALRKPVTRLFGPRIAYCLWAAPALRMILPPLPESWFGTGLTKVQDVVVVLTGNSSHPLQSPAATGGGVAWSWILLGLWLGGASFFFLTHFVQYWRFTRAVQAASEPLFAAGRIKVASSPTVASPIAFGVFGKAIIVPADFLHRFDEIEQRLAISHEHVHHRRGDLPVNVAALAILSLHWFNPLAHFAHRAFRLDQEAACDAVVLAGANPHERQAYGQALYKSATGGVPLVACAMGTASQLKERLRCIIAHAERPARLSDSGLAVVLVAGGLVATASASAPDTVPASVFASAQPSNIAPVAPVATVRLVRISGQAGRDKASHREMQALITAPAPPANPERRDFALIDSAPDESAPALPPALPAALQRVSCLHDSRYSVVSQQSTGLDGSRQAISIIICGRDVDQTNQLIPAHIAKDLEMARSRLISEQAIGAAHRAQLILLLNAQLNQLQSENEAPVQTHPAI